MRLHLKQTKYQYGISLIELVIFIVILSVALTGITLIYINTTRYSADPMVRIRSIELAQSTLEEILLKAYDDATPVGGGCVRFAANSLCPVGAPPNPVAATETLGLGSEEGVDRPLFDDVDDYNNQLYCGDNVVPSNTACPALACQDMLDESGNDISTEYSGLSVCIQVSFAGNELNAVDVAPGTGTNVSANDAKRIDVIVADTLNSRIGLSAYRLNF